MFPNMTVDTRPAPDDSTRPYWEAARDERLVMQRCDACGSMQYPPDLVCNNCQSADRHFEEVSGRGTVYSHAVYTRSFSAGFEAPYVLALVDLEDHPELRMLTNIVETDPEKVEIGMPVEVVFESRGEWKIPQFRPAGVRS